MRAVCICRFSIAVPKWFMQLDIISIEYKFAVISIVGRLLWPIRIYGAILTAYRGAKC